MYTLSKFDIATIRKADVLCVHLSKRNPAGLVRLIKRVDRTNAFQSDQEHVLDVPVTLYGYQHRDAIANGAQCYGHVTFYHQQRTTAACIIETLKAGDQISFEFYPDAQSNGYTAKAQLHADALYLIVHRNEGRNRFQWELDVSICPDNSARMCQGVPSSKDYQEAMTREVLITEMVAS